MVRLGNEEFLADPGRYVDGKNMALVVNQSSYTPRMQSLISACANMPGFNPVAIFGPEHGVAGAMQDMESVPDDASAPIPVLSLYGASESSLKPPVDVLKKIDALIVDLQDVGSRYYTFIWTMLYCMEACEKSGAQMIVCDRPNPLGGEIIEGSLQKGGFLSFVGRHPIPIRHAMTMGEIALLLKDALTPKCRLKIAPMRGWRRKMWFDETGLPWIAPSPNMPTPHTAICYPGACLAEGTTLSEGRGTTTPFEQIGAPGIDGEKLAAAMNEMRLPGCLFRPVAFVPKFQKYAGQSCFGVFVHVTDRNVFKPVETYMRLIRQISLDYPESFGWRRDAYEFVKDIPAIDLLTGSDDFRKALDMSADIRQIFCKSDDDAKRFAGARKQYLMYE